MKSSKENRKCWKFEWKVHFRNGYMFQSIKELLDPIKLINLLVYFFYLFFNWIIKIDSLKSIYLCSYKNFAINQRITSFNQHFQFNFKIHLCKKLKKQKNETFNPSKVYFLSLSYCIPMLTATKPHCAWPMTQRELNILYIH